MSGDSVDLRERVIQAWQAGHTQAWIAATFSLSVSSIKRYIQRFQTMGGVEPTVQQRQQPLIGAADRVALERFVTTQPDATLADYGEKWFHETQMRVSSATMSRSLIRYRITRKKRPSGRPNATK